MADTLLTRTDIDLDEFVATARAWLDANATRRATVGTSSLVPGDPFNVAVFHAAEFHEEQAMLAALREWNQRKAEHGYHAITESPEFGGLGLSRDHSRAFGRMEAEYETPTRHELFGVTTGLIAPTVRQFGNDEQRQRFVAPLLRSDIFCCQLFSEPAAGSDLAGLGCRAVRDGDEWIVNGQKVWSSGAQFAEFGELIARSDPHAPKHRGLTAFLLPMETPGVEVRPIKQMSGGSSFNEVFLADVRIPDSLRLGSVGDGWKVALGTLGFERDHSSGQGGTIRPGGSWSHVVATARALGRTDDPVLRQRLMKLYSHIRVEHFVNRRAADLRAAGALPGPEGSLGKLLWTEGMRQMSDVVTQLVGPALMADTGQWGTYEWTEHVLGAPGYRIAGGSDEVQRNILGERVLGLAPEPRSDKDVPWNEVPR